MSDILIKGMKMPVTCCHCPLMGYAPEIEWNDGGGYIKGVWHEVQKLSEEVGEHRVSVTDLRRVLLEEYEIEVSK